MAELRGLALIALILAAVLTAAWLVDRQPEPAACPELPAYGDCAWRCESTGESDAAYAACMTVCSTSTTSP